MSFTLYSAALDHKKRGTSTLNKLALIEMHAVTLPHNVLFILNILNLIPVSFALHTCAKGDGVDKRARDLLSCSLVPEGKVISIKHSLLVLSCQKVSEGAHRRGLM